VVAAGQEVIAQLHRQRVPKAWQVDFRELGSRGVDRQAGEAVAPLDRSLSDVDVLHPRAWHARDAPPHDARADVDALGADPVPKEPVLDGGPALRRPREDQGGRDPHGDDQRVLPGGFAAREYQDENDHQKRGHEHAPRDPVDDALEIDPGRVEGAFHVIGHETNLVSRSHALFSPFPSCGRRPPTSAIHVQKSAVSNQDTTQKLAANACLGWLAV